MEFEKKQDGKTVYPAQFKQRVLEELATGVSTTELSRKYQIPMQNIHRWVRKMKAGAESNYVGGAPEEMIAVTSVRQMAQDYEKQIKQLKKSLANMTMDRDILKDAVDLAAKKKWI